MKGTLFVSSSLHTLVVFSLSTQVIFSSQSRCGFCRTLYKVYISVSFFSGTTGKAARECKKAGAHAEQLALHVALPSLRPRNHSREGLQAGVGSRVADPVCRLSW